MSKRIIAFLLALVLLLSACSAGESIKAPVNFYYLRSDLQREQELVIDSEVREAYGHTEDLYYLVLLYLRGPASDALYSPFPATAGLSRLSEIGDTLFITLSGINLTDQTKLEATLACACLAKTCFELTDITSVRVNTEAGLEADEGDIVIHKDSLILFDESAFPTDSEPTEE